MSTKVSPTAPQCYVGDGPVGLLIAHGFTATPMSMSPIAEAARSVNMPFEQPLLPGHGTNLDDLLARRWFDWLDHLIATHDRLAERVDQVVAVGQSMGGALALNLALERSVAGIVAINPLIQPRSAADYRLIEELIGSGVDVAPPIGQNPDRPRGGDIADPDAIDFAYSGTPLAPLRSMLIDGVEPTAARLGEIEVPLLLFSSRLDHVVEPANSEFLAQHYGGPVDHRWLDRSYHVAAIDYDRDLIADATLKFASGLDGVAR